MSGGALPNHLVGGEYMVFILWVSSTLVIRTTEIYGWIDVNCQSLNIKCCFSYIACSWCLVVWF